MKKQTKTVTLSTKSSTCESFFLKDHNVIFNQSRPPMGVPIQNLMLVNVLHSGDTLRASARECFPECDDPVLTFFHNDIFTRDSLPRSTVSMDVSIQKSMPAKVLQSEYSKVLQSEYNSCAQIEDKYLIRDQDSQLTFTEMIQTILQEILFSAACLLVGNKWNTFHGLSGICIG